MGRQLRRVPLDFSHPIGVKWPGFLNPWYAYRKDCSACGGTGYSPMARLFQDQWYGYVAFDAEEYGAVPLTIDSYTLRESVIQKLKWSQKLADDDGKPDYWTDGGRISFDVAVDREIDRMFGIWSGMWMHQLNQDDVDALVEAGRLHDFTSTWTREDGWKLKDPPYRPTAEEVNAWGMFGMGHDSINSWVCIKARCEREGHPTGCTVCDGSGDHWTPSDAEHNADDWQEEEPPTGNGYQLWETVSEGSPVTPVFAVPERLAEWLVQNDDSVTKDTTFDQWMRFICGDGWAPSNVMVNGRMLSGVKAIGTVKTE
jgi:hypothetical protein